MATQRTYLAIDLKSFYASVECVDRHLDPLTTNLVVADASRTEKTICLAVSPSLKAYKIPGRARLFEAVQRVKEVNAQRLQTAIQQHKAVRGEDGKYRFASTSFDANALNADPALGLSYIVAPPRMQRYLDVSTQIYKTYLKYVSPADIYPYSIDEVFIDVTGYLPYYHMSAHELAMTMVREVLYNTGITATAGIGTNLYLAKLAMDIVAKHIPADKDGVRIAELDEQSYRYLLWNHRPLTDFWMTGPGTVKRLEAHGIYTMGDLARFSIHGEDRLYEIFGVDAEILIDHAWGCEPCGMAEIKSYKPSTNSISEGQVLSTPYAYDIDGMNQDQLDALEQMPVNFANKICDHIIKLQEKTARENFYNWLEVGKIVTEPRFKLTSLITLSGKASSLTKSLYKQECELDDNFEYDMAMALTGIDSVRWWHRNPTSGRNAFCLNAFRNHYPDFIVMTNSGKVLLVETKGDQLENAESREKIKLGRAWQNAAGSQYRYYMVFQNKDLHLEGAYRFDEFLKILGEL